jgi:hypothetical protein
MKTMRVVTIVLALLLALAACGGAAEEEPAAADNNAEQEGMPEEEANEEELSEEGDKGTDAESLEEEGGGYIYRREGGIAGFCDVVEILAGTATVSNCATEPPEIVGEVALTIEQAQLVSTWIEDLATFDHEQSDPAVADAMTISLVFDGQGEGEATEEHIAAMVALAEEVLAASAGAGE